MRRPVLARSYIMPAVILVFPGVVAGCTRSSMGWISGGDSGYGRICQQTGTGGVAAGSGFPLGDMKQAPETRAANLSVGIVVYQLSKIFACPPFH